MSSKSYKKRIILGVFTLILAFAFIKFGSQKSGTHQIPECATPELPAPSYEKGKLGDHMKAVSPQTNISLFSSRQETATHTPYDKKLDLFANVDRGKLINSINDLPLDKRIPVNEKAKYHILWNSLHVGDAFLETQFVSNDSTKISIQASVKSYSLIDHIYPVNDYFTSIVEAKTCYPFSYFKDQSEGWREKQELITVYPLSQFARYQRFEEDKETRNTTYDITKQVSDPLSIIYRVRCMNMDELTDSLTLNVLNNKRLSKAKLDLGPKTSVSVPLGEFHCHQLSVDMNYPGLFKTPPKGEAKIYLEKNSNLLVKAEVTLSGLIGHVSLILVDWQEGHYE